MHEKNVEALCARSILYPTACMQPRIDWHAPTPQFLSRNSPSFCDASCTCCFGSLILTFPFPGCV